MINDKTSWDDRYFSLYSNVRIVNYCYHLIIFRLTILGVGNVNPQMINSPTELPGRMHVFIRGFDKTKNAALMSIFFEAPFLEFLFLRSDDYY
jgi:hypothetical protein